METEERNRPQRAIGFRDLVLFYVVTGISLRWISTAAAAGPSAIIIWIVAWLAFYVPLALSVIELSSRYPEEGGLYVWSKRAFGDFGGFISAWIYWASNLPYFPTVLYFAAGNALFVSSSRWSHFSKTSYFVSFSVLALALIVILNITGVGIARWLYNVGAVSMWISAMIVIVMGIICWVRFGPATEFSRTSLTPSTRLKDVIFWSTITFALGGCEAASFMGGEIKGARRNIPSALIIGGSLVTMAYILGTVCVLLALPQSEVSSLQGLMEAIVRAAQRIGFAPIVPIAALLITLSNLGAAGAFLAAAARLPFVAGIDRFLPAAFASLHPRWRTPYIALLTQGIFGALFIFLGQAGSTVKAAYDVFVNIGVIMYFIPYLFVFAALVRLQREVAGPDVIRVPGGKPIAFIVATVGFAASFTTIVLSLIPPQGEVNKVLGVTKVVGLTMLLSAIGVCLYLVGRRKIQATTRGSRA